MKALSLKQPWAWAVFNGKEIENRRWPTKIRGRIYIHASKTFDMEGWQWLASNENRLGIVLPDYYETAFVKGAIVGEVDIVDCVRNSGSRWFFGPYGFVLSNAKQYTKPIACRGMPRFFEPDIQQSKGGS